MRKEWKGKEGKKTEGLIDAPNAINRETINKNCEIVLFQTVLGTKYKKKGGSARYPNLNQPNSSMRGDEGVFFLYFKIKQKEGVFGFRQGIVPPLEWQEYSNQPFVDSSPISFMNFTKDFLCTRPEYWPSCRTHIYRRPSLTKHW